MKTSLHPNSARTLIAIITLLGMSLMLGLSACSTHTGVSTPVGSVAAGASTR